MDEYNDDEFDDPENKENQKNKYHISNNADQHLKRKSAGTMQYSDFIENEDEVDEIIKQHLLEEESSLKKPKKKDSGEIEDETEKKQLEDEIEVDIDKDDYDYIDDSLNFNVKSPKQTLIDHLRLLADIFNSSIDGASEYYDQIFDERAQFLLDFENILKIMTFDETVEYVLPCM